MLSFLVGGSQEFSQQCRAIVDTSTALALPRRVVSVWILQLDRVVKNLERGHPGGAVGPVGGARDKNSSER